ncbi:hypothetical protein [Promicromonospora sp. NPDC019610]|uniref:hypothetical protein n=1 Tax=Promicromonospora sp. NPDC019610 TaxID=3364405 RepID=UPI0037B63551
MTARTSSPVQDHATHGAANEEARRTRRLPLPRPRGRLAEQEPGLRDDILLGGAACLAMEGDMAAFALDRWKNGDSALLAPPDDPERPDLVFSGRER